MINLKQKYKDELNNIFTKYCPQAEIWAYGSRVNGDSHSGSDLDLVVKTFNEENKSLYELRALLNDSDLPFLIDIQEYEHLPESFQKEILKGYVKIFPNSIPELF